MKFVANKLAAKLKPLRYGVPANPTLPQSDCVIFQDGKAFTFSGEVFAVIDLPFPVVGAVNYKQLYEVLVKYGPAEVEIVPDGATFEVQKCNGKSKTKFTYDPQIILSLQSVLQPVADGWKPVPAEFGDAVKMCESVVELVRTDEVMSSINVTPKCMEAVSATQVVRCRCPLDIPNRFLARGGILEGMQSIEPKELQYVENNNVQWFYLRNAGVSVATPVYKDDFVSEMDDYLAPSLFKVKFPSELLADIPVACAVLEKKDKLVVSLRGGKCFVSANGKHGVHQIEADLEEPVQQEMTFQIAPDLFQYVISKFTECTVSQHGIRVRSDKLMYTAAVELRNDGI